MKKDLRSETKKSKITKERKLERKIRAGLFEKKEIKIGELVEKWIDANF